MFPNVNEVSLTSWQGGLAQGPDRSAEALNTGQRRKHLTRYKRDACFFGLLANAAQAESFCHAHLQGFHAPDPVVARMGYVSGGTSKDNTY